jgi:phenylacetate-CoA ligase
VVNPQTLEPANEGELILTNLGRLGSPVIRYRTGDRVCLNRQPCECGRTFVRTDGGIIGRIDQMLIVRGVNIFPSAIEAIVRAFPQVVEFAVELSTVESMDKMEIKVEVADASPQAIVQALAREIYARLGLRARVTLAPPQTLPRFELKANRIADRRVKW